MSHRVRVGLAGLGRLGRIHAAGPAARCPSDGVRYTVKQESR